MNKITTGSGANKSLLKLITPYKNPSLNRSIWQIINTLLPYVLLWIVLSYAIEQSFWLVLPLSILAAGFLVRLFIIFHDCGHGAFFESKTVSDIFGVIFGILTFTPYHRWHHAHLIHHRTAGNLDKRGIGDIWTMTVEEFKQSSPRQKLYYKIYRNPFILLGIGAPLIFLIVNRFTSKDFTKRDRISVYITNLGIVAIAFGMSYLIGFTNYLIIQFLIVYMASAAGVFLFYVQHQFPDVHWYRDESWDYSTVAIQGASYLKLPKVLQWFSGNIGFHHIHHLSSKIPNYNLEKCLNENEPFQKVKAVTLKSAILSLKLRLWDENQQQLVTYKQAEVL